jgi:hypothetical protein
VQDGLDLAIDFNADVAINTGRRRLAEDPPEEDDREPETESPDEGEDR